MRTRVSMTDSRAEPGPRTEASPSLGLPPCGPPDREGRNEQSAMPGPDPYGRPARRSGRTPAEPYPPAGQARRYDGGGIDGNTEREPALVSPRP